MSASSVGAPWQGRVLADAGGLGRRAGLTGSILFHLGAAALLLWLQARPVPGVSAADESVELVFEALPAAVEPAPAATPPPVTAVAPKPVPEEPEPEAPALMEAVLPAPPPPPAVASQPDAVAKTAPSPPVRVPPRMAVHSAPPPARMAAPHVAARTPEPAASAAAMPSPPDLARPAPVARPAATAAVDPAWRMAMSSWLRAHQRYPEMARQRGTEGTVGLTFTVARNGQVQTVVVTSSSGSPVLDDAGREMLDGQRLPAFPAEMAQLQAQVSVNIRYTLD